MEQSQLIKYHTQHIVSLRRDQRSSQTDSDSSFQPILLIQISHFIGVEL